jgi:hypothetical protein
MASKRSREWLMPVRSLVRPDAAFSAAWQDVHRGVA